MNIKQKLLRHLCMFSGLMLTGNMAHAACSVSASGTSSISVPSIYLMEMVKTHHNLIRVCRVQVLAWL